MTNTDRITRLERRVRMILHAVVSLCRWFGHRRVNAKSCTLTGPEALAFRAQMAQHGVNDDESRDEQPEQSRAAR